MAGFERRAIGGLRALRRAPARSTVVVCLAAVLAVPLLTAFEDEAVRHTRGRPPEQFHRDLVGGLPDEHGDVLVIAHNSGDSVSAAKEALRHGADVIEIDVVRAGDRLYASHDSLLRFVGRWVFRGPSLERVWAETADAGAMKLDLKESGDRYIDLVVEFLSEHDDRRVFVATGNRHAAARLAREAPRAELLWTVGGSRSLTRLQGDPELVNLVDGVSVRDHLLDGPVMRWLHGNRLRVVAWVVNDSDRLAEVMRLRVDAVATDNLAVMEVLGR